MANLDAQLRTTLKAGGVLQGNVEEDTISAQVLVELIRSGTPTVEVNGVRIQGNVDLEGCLTIGSLSLKHCWFEGDINLKNTEILSLDLSMSRLVFLDATGARVAGNINLHAISSSDSELLGLPAPTDWFNYDIASSNWENLTLYPQPACQVILANASIKGNLNFADARLVAKAGVPRDEGYENAINLAQASVQGNIHAVDRSRNEPSKTSLLGRLMAQNLYLKGDFWGNGGMFIGHSTTTKLNLESINLQGANIEGSWLFQSNTGDDSNTPTQNPALLRGNFWALSSTISGHLRLTHITSEEPCAAILNAGTFGHVMLSPGGTGFSLDLSTAGFINGITILGHYDKIDAVQCSVNGKLIFEGILNNFDLSEANIHSSVLIGGTITNSLNIENLACKGDLKLFSSVLGSTDLDGVSVGGSFFLGLEPTENPNQTTSPTLLVQNLKGRSASVFGGPITARNIRVEGSCLTYAQFLAKVNFKRMTVAGNFSFHPTIHNTFDLSGSHIHGSMNFSGDVETDDRQRSLLTLALDLGLDERRHLCDKQLFEDNFNYIALNGRHQRSEFDGIPPRTTTLILKNLRIDGALLTHRINVDLGEQDRSDRIDWPDRFRESRRKLLRRIEYYLEHWSENSTPAYNLSSSLRQTISRKLHTTYGQVSRDVHVIGERNTPLSFFNVEVQPFRVEITERIFGSTKSGLFDALCVSDDDEIRIY